MQDHTRARNDLGQAPEGLRPRSSDRRAETRPLGRFPCNASPRGDVLREQRGTDRVMDRGWECARSSRTITRWRPVPGRGWRTPRHARPGQGPGMAPGPCGASPYPTVKSMRIPPAQWPGRGSLPFNCNPWSRRLPRAGDRVINRGIAIDPGRVAMLPHRRAATVLGYDASAGRWSAVRLGPRMATGPVDRRRTGLADGGAGGGSCRGHGPMEAPDPDRGAATTPPARAPPHHDGRGPNLARVAPDPFEPRTMSFFQRFGPPPRLWAGTKSQVGSATAPRWALMRPECVVHSRSGCSRAPPRARRHAPRGCERRGLGVDL